MNSLVTRQATVRLPVFHGHKTEPTAWAITFDLPHWYIYDEVRHEDVFYVMETVSKQMLSENVIDIEKYLRRKLFHSLFEILFDKERTAIAVKVYSTEDRLTGVVEYYLFAVTQPMKKLEDGKG